MLYPHFITDLDRRGRSTNLDVAFRKPGVKLLSWMREVLESVLAPGVAGADLMRVAFKIRREMYASVPRMTAAILWSVLKGGRCAAQSWDHTLFVRYRACGDDAQDASRRSIYCPRMIDTRYATGDQ